MTRLTLVQALARIADLDESNAAMADALDRRDEHWARLHRVYASGRDLDRENLRGRLLAVVPPELREAVNAVFSDYAAAHPVTVELLIPDAAIQSETA